MIKGIGTDIIEVERIAKAIQKKYFLKKAFSDSEINLAKSKGASFFAGNFAVKEAFVKALGIGFRGVELRDIEVLRDSFGKPYIRISNKENTLLKGIDEDLINVSISNTKSLAVAMVVIEK